jgi:Fe-S-cluster containining protein
MVIKDPYKLKPLYKFLNKIDKESPRNLQRVAMQATEDIWKNIDCLSCANCCKVMTPTYTNADIKKIAAYLHISANEMKKRWLRKEKGVNKWVNKSKPCQFLDLQTNLCTVYEVRPADCAGFPHLTKKRFFDYTHVHKQNLNECPATFKMVEKIGELIDRSVID